MTAPTAGRFEGREHRLPVRVYYEDTDFTGIVYHGSYVRFFERGRSDFLRLVGVDHAELLDQTEPTAFAITRMDIRYLAAARIDDALEVRTLYQAVRGPRLIIAQSIWRGDTHLTSADVEAVCIRMDGRPRRPTAAMVEKVKPYLAPADQG